MTIDFKKHTDCSGVGRIWEEIRKFLHMSESEFANALGCSASTISRISNGKTGVSIVVERRILAISLIGWLRYKSLSTGEKSEIKSLSGMNLLNTKSMFDALDDGPGNIVANFAFGITAISNGGNVIIPGGSFIGPGFVEGLKDICRSNGLKCEHVVAGLRITKMEENHE